MSLFDIILVQPIFNVLVLIYGIVPGHDFGLSLILFTILVRLVMWPLVKKQLNQTKVMRSLQPELAKIKAKTKGNKQLESQLMLELYKEKGVNPFGSIGLLVVQLPIFISLFAVVRLITENAANITKYTYNPLEQLPAVHNAINGDFSVSFFGLIDLTKHAIEPGSGVIYWPLLIMAVIAAAMQFVQSKQLLPQPSEKKRLRDLLKEQASGKDIDQAEMSALVTNKMVWLFPILTFMVSIYMAGALVLYLLITSAVAVAQQYWVLKKDESELEKMSEKTKKRAETAQNAQVVALKKGAKKKRRK
ncbi:MAG TPA: YidC/Oxa1 family membrane protein insertase [Candidatus Saccharimonadales bacterium]|nr:YidC/Oxa1 family membrane protein insertase [Candidatus Saccharimonadales bacterium]